MSTIVCSLQGRFGNQVMQYLFCRGFVERWKHLGWELRVEPWVGERVFDLSDARPDGREVRRGNEIELLQEGGRPEPSRNGVLDLEFRGYAQMQAAMIYTKRQAQAWLKLRPEIEAACGSIEPLRVVAHHRKGDYIGYGYPVVTRASYFDACAVWGLDQRQLQVLCEEEYEWPRALPDDLAFVADFYRMMTAKVLLRGNSSFSWLAGLLGNGLVLAPVIDGLEGGREHDCRFVAGNWPRFANMDFVTDLHVAP